MLVLSAVVWWSGVLAPAPRAFAEEPTGDAPFVKFYVVAQSYRGAPETLTTIAVRILGSGERAGELFQLNSGRPQPDGGSLSDPAELHADWVLLLPWDAAGAGVQYGQLPARGGGKATAG